MKAVIVNLVKQFIDIVWNGKKFEPTQLCEAVFDGIMSGVLDKLSIKSPKYIRDIKAKARSKGIKGTKKLVQYLTKQKIKVSIWNLGLEALKDFCYNVVKSIIIAIICGILSGILADTLPKGANKHINYLMKNFGKKVKASIFKSGFGKNLMKAAKYVFKNSKKLLWKFIKSYCIPNTLISATPRIKDALGV